VCFSPSPASIAAASQRTARGERRRTWGCPAAQSAAAATGPAASSRAKHSGGRAEETESGRENRQCCSAAVVFTLLACSRSLITCCSVLACLSSWILQARSLRFASRTRLLSISCSRTASVAASASAEAEEDDNLAPGGVAAAAAAATGSADEAEEEAVLESMTIAVLQSLRGTTAVRQESGRQCAREGWQRREGCRRAEGCSERDAAEGGAAVAQVERGDGGETTLVAQCITKLQLVSQSAPNCRKQSSAMPLSSAFRLRLTRQTRCS
jgi:hypothetical protein